MNRHTVRIGNIAQSIRGVTYEKKDARDAAGAGLTPLLRATNINDGALDFDELVFVPNGVIKDEQRLRIGDILLAASSGSLSVVGKAGLLKNSFLGTFGAFCYVVRSHAKYVLPEYLAYFMRTAEYRTKVSQLAAGVNINNLRRDHIESIELPLVGLNEQRRIVEAIESYLSRLDAAVESLERAYAKLKAYRASVLRAAVEGRLVPTEFELARAENRNYETAEVLLKRSFMERRRRREGAEIAKITADGKPATNARWKFKDVDSAALQVQDLGQLPQGWCWAKLDQVITEPLANGKSVPDGDGFPVLRLTAIGDGVVDLSQRKTGNWKGVDPTRYRVRLDDFFIVRGNGSLRLVGRAGLVASEPDPVAYPDTLIRAPINAKVIFPRYLLKLWHSPVVRGQLERRAKTTAGIYKVNQMDLAETVFPLAPIAEQVRIGNELARIDSLIAVMLRDVSTSRDRCSKLRSAILNWAFEGKLVDQDPTDEPASILLERIRTERASDTPAMKTKSRRKVKAVQ